MRALQLVAGGLGLAGWGLLVWFHVVPWPLEVAVRAGRAPPAPAATAPAAVVHHVAAQAGAQGLARPLTVPAGLWQVQAQVAQPFGPTRGLEAVAVGDAVQLERFGLCTGRACTPGGLLLGPRAVTIHFVALGGLFDHEGLLALTLVPAGAPRESAAGERP